jgi:hypothetical protein
MKCCNMGRINKRQELFTQRLDDKNVSGRRVRTIRTDGATNQTTAKNSNLRPSSRSIFFQTPQNINREASICRASMCQA